MKMAALADFSGPGFLCHKKYDGGLGALIPPLFSIAAFSAQNALSIQTLPDCVSSTVSPPCLERKRQLLCVFVNRKKVLCGPVTCSAMDLRFMNSAFMKSCGTVTFEPGYVIYRR